MAGGNLFLLAVVTQPAPLPAAAAEALSMSGSARLGRRPRATWGRDCGEGEQGVGQRCERMELDPGFVEVRKARRE